MGQSFIMNDLVLPLRKTPEQKLDKQENNTQGYCKCKMRSGLKIKEEKDHHEKQQLKARIPKNTSELFTPNSLCSSLQKTKLNIIHVQLISKL
jgi:hypothetical protein